MKFPDFIHAVKMEPDRGIPRRVADELGMAALPAAAPAIDMPASPALGLVAKSKPTLPCPQAAVRRHRCRGWWSV